MSQGLKLLLDFGPLLAFFLGNWKGGIFWGTGLFMVATIIALAVTYAVTRKIARFPLFTAIFVAIFGGLTIYLHDATFIKVKVTLIDILFGSVLLGGLMLGKTFLKEIMGDAVQMPQDAWRRLTIRWAIFFFALAALNEYVWRHYTDDQWVNFKVFGTMGLTLLFMLANLPFLMRHMTDTDEKPSANG